MKTASTMTLTVGVQDYHPTSLPCWEKLRNWTEVVGHVEDGIAASEDDFFDPEYVHPYDHLDDFQPYAGGVGVDIDGGDGDLLPYDPFHFHHQLHHLHPMMNQVVHRTYQLAF